MTTARRTPTLERRPNCGCAPKNGLERRPNRGAAPPSRAQTRNQEEERSFWSLDEWDVGFLTAGVIMVVAVATFEGIKRGKQILATRNASPSAP